MNPGLELPSIFRAREKIAYVGCKVSLTESYQGIQGAKYCPYTSLRLSCQGCRKMPISSYCSAHTYSLWMSLDFCAKFKAEQHVVLFWGIMACNILTHSFYMVAV